MKFKLLNPYITSSNTFTEMLLTLIVQINGIGSSIYGIPGATWYQANKNIQQFISNNSINYVHACNESSSLYMASYEALSLNKVGVTFSTSGPGTLMATPGVGTTFYESNPLVCFFGVPVVDFQFIDKSLFSTICKYVFYIDNNTINPQTMLLDAFTIAKYGTPSSPGKGPVAVFVLDSCWYSTYKYTPMSNSTLSYPININYTVSFIRKIFSNFNSSSKIIIRVGERVDPEIVKKLADLSNIYKNIFITLTLLSKTYINPLEYSNVGIDGPISNPTINQLYKNATVVIDVGDGQNYSGIIYTDIYPYMKENTPLFYILNSKSKYPPSSSNISNTLYMNVNIFLNLFLKFYVNVPFPLVAWSDVRQSESTYVSTILNAYKSQTSLIDNTTLTTISIVAQCFDVIYKNQPNNYTNGNLEMVIDDNLLYSTDVGLVSFLTNSFIRLKNTMAISILGEFSAIGSSISVTAGYLRTNKYKGAVMVIGDGGFLNVSSYLIDLCKVLNENPDYSILILLMNDNCYTNVAEGELVLFGNYTSITSTSSLQIGIDLGTIASSFFGSKLSNYKKITDTFDSSELTDFITSWYTTRPYGASILHYSTSVGQPYQIT